jgi:hypothetical protein
MCDGISAADGGIGGDCAFPAANFGASCTAMDRRRIDACLPRWLHGFSRQVLEHYLDGRLSTHEFRRWFHMPNSDYLPVSDCVAQLVDPAYIPESRLPASTTLITRKSI